MNHANSNVSLHRDSFTQSGLSGDTSSLSSSGNEDNPETGFVQEKNHNRTRWWKDVHRTASGSGIRKRAKTMWVAQRHRHSIMCVAIFLTTMVIAIVSMVLLVYFNVTLRRQIPHNDIQRVLASWGQPGSPTEFEAKFPTDFSRDIIPRHCHSHNDYLRRVPLYDALAAGCTGVEADVWLTSSNTDLLVGHTKQSLAPSRSLKSLYIDPLLSILAYQNPQLLPGVNTSSTSEASNIGNTSLNGVFDVDVNVSLTLLIDIKTDGPTTFPSVLAELEPLRSGGWLTHWNGSAVVPAPITVVGTGNTPFSLLASNATYRDIFFDAPLAQLWGEDSPSNNTIYTSDNSDYASTSFKEAVGEVWHGILSPSQVEIVRGQVGEASKRGLRARYWETPSWPVAMRDHVWDVLEKEGVGMLSVDDLTAATQRSWSN